jgi:myo-inositol-1(or 4)-monophosphatase
MVEEGFLSFIIQHSSFTIHRGRGAGMDELERVARAAVAEAGPLIRAAWQRGKQVEYKGAIDPVTDTDRRVEALVAERLRRAFPDHLIVAEEASAGTTPVRPPADRYAWYLDPLDGTVNFAHGYPMFSIALAVARGPEVLFGIVHDPVRDETFTARPGAGAFVNAAPIRVSETPDLDRALVGTGFPYDTRTHADYYVGFLRDFLGHAQGVRRGGSAAIDLCYVACGRLDGFWEWKLHPWDTVAGALIVREAGGAVGDFRGAPFDPYGPQTLASNGRIHAAMVRVLAQRLRC